MFPAAQKIRRRHNDIIAELAHGISCLLIGNRPVVMRDKENPSLALRRGIRRGLRADRQSCQQQAET